MTQPDLAGPPLAGGAVNPGVAVAYRSPALGVIALLLALFALVFGVVYGLQAGAVDRLTGVAPYVPDSIFAFSMLTSLVALVMSIVATAKNLGRGAGITGIVFAVLGPVFTVLAFFLSLAVHIM